MNPQPEKLILDQHDGELDLYDDAQLVRTFEWVMHPDSAQVAHATWKGKDLIGEFKTRRGGSARQTFELSADGKTLTVVMHMDRRDGEAVELTSRYAKYEGE